VSPVGNCDRGWREAPCRWCRAGEGIHRSAQGQARRKRGPPRRFRRGSFSAARSLMLKGHGAHRVGTLVASACGIARSCRRSDNRRAPAFKWIRSPSPSWLYRGFRLAPWAHSLDGCLLRLNRSAVTGGGASNFALISAVISGCSFRKRASSRVPADPLLA